MCKFLLKTQYLLLCLSLTAGLTYFRHKLEGIPVNTRFCGEVKPILFHDVISVLELVELSEKFDRNYVKDL